MGQINKISIQFWITGYLDVTEQKRNSCSTYHSFNVFFSITTYNFITTGRQLKLASKYLPVVFSLSLHFYALLLQSYRNQVKEISKNLKNQARVYLAVLEKIVIFQRFQNGNINLFRITNEESWFLIS